MGRSRYRFLYDDCPHFMTCTVIKWIPVFRNEDIVRLVLNSLKFMIENRRLALHGWVIMEDHIHMMASALNLSKEIHDFKSFTARSIIDFLEEKHFRLLLNQFTILKKQHKINQQYQFWEEGCHPEMILNTGILTQKLDYIHYNPVRRGLVDDPSQWRYSSHVDYHEGQGLLPIERIQI